MAPQYVPSLYVLLCTAVIVGLKRWPALAFLYLGTYTSWLYLRYFQQQPESAIRGDPSEEFAFSSFFPVFMAPPIDAVGGVLARVTGLKHGAHAEAKPLLPTVQTVLGSNSADANRRRWVDGWLGVWGTLLVPAPQVVMLAMSPLRDTCSVGCGGLQPAAVLYDDGAFEVPVLLLSWLALASLAASRASSSFRSQSKPLVGSQLG